MSKQSISLPIDEYLPQIVENLRLAKSLVLQAEPGAGKTTRVAPALLDAGLACAGGKDALIVLLQPRRIAARAAAERIASERNLKLGEQVGYQVRFDKRFSDKTRILVMTEGVFLRRLQSDPLLEDIAVVIFDEFHERSIDSDLSLAMVQQVRSQLRDDLHVLVMSATMETAPVAEFLGGAPVIACPGRSFPVEIDYLNFQGKESIAELVASAVKETLARRNGGHLLAFLPGVGEIHRCRELLEDFAQLHDFLLMPLFGEMSLDEQKQVLEACQKRKIILATNVAETSLTIDGISAVVDGGMCRVNKLDPKLGLNRLELVRISKASAEQRAGRSGRNAPGYCLRLWDRKQQQALSEAQLPEVARVEISQCLLQLYAWGEADPAAFPWFEAPSASSLKQAINLLGLLGALENGRLSKLGKQMAELPLQPRLARLLIEGVRLGQAERAALAAALLSERDPFIKRSDKSRDYGQAQLRQHHSDSDLLDRIEAIEAFSGSARAGSHRPDFDRWLKFELNSGAAKQVLKAGKQLIQLLEERGFMKTAKAGGSNADSDRALLQAIFAAFPDRLCKRRESKGERALMTGGRGVRLAESSAVVEAELFVAVELIDTGKSESLVKQASLVERDWLPDSALNAVLESSYDNQKERVQAMRRLYYFDLPIEETQVPLPPDTDAAQILADAVCANFKIEDLLSEDCKEYLARIAFLKKHMPELELPELSDSLRQELLLDWCATCSSIAELRQSSQVLMALLQSRLNSMQLAALEKDAPTHITVPSGSKCKISYSESEQPLLAVRIQELFGMAQSPSLAAGRVPLLLHLLAPNYRVQQITSDLSSFWKNSYADVRKDLRARYPKHSWPEDPLSAKPESRPQRKARAN